MWDSVELVEVKLQLRTDVDVSTLVFSGIAIFGCRED